MNCSEISKKENLRWSMESMLGIHLAPTPQHRPLYRQKCLFLSANMASHPPSPCIYTMYKINTIIQLAVKELALSYDRWDREQPSPELKQKMCVQHKNLLILEQTLSKLNNSNYFHTILSDNLKETLQPFVAGDLYFDQNTLTQIEKAPKEHLNPIKYLKELAEQRKSSPISSKAIQQQAELFLASRLADEGKLIVPLIESRNQVYRLFPKGETPSKEVAFFKISPTDSRDNLSAAGKMEAFMYDIAVIMGQEELFTPTKEKALLWEKKENENKLITKLRGIQGSVQPTVQGQLLLDYLRNPTQQVPIDRRVLLKTVLAVIVFGMYDAHQANIFVDPKGNLKFFDNTRSLPHSNGTLLLDSARDDSFLLKPSFRVSLVALAGCYEGLSDPDRLLLQTELANYKARFPTLIRYLKSQKNRIATLPKGWFRSQAVLSSMNERLQSVEAALQNPSVKSLRDILMDSLPEFKYLGAIAVLTEGLSQNNFKKDQKIENTTLNEMQQKYLKDVSLIEPLIARASMFLRINFQEFRKACTDHKISINELIRIGLERHFKTPVPDKDMFSHYQEQIRTYNLEASFCIKDVQDGRKRLEELFNPDEFNKNHIRAELDYEIDQDPFFDLPLEKAPSPSINTTVAQLWRDTIALLKTQSYIIVSDLKLSQKTEGKILVPEISQERLELLVDMYGKSGKGVFTHDEYPHLYFNYKDAEEILRKLAIDHETKPGTFLCGNQQITLKDLTALVQEKKQIGPQSTLGSQSVALNPRPKSPVANVRQSTPNIEEKPQTGKPQASEDSSACLTLTSNLETPTPLRHSAHNILPPGSNPVVC